VQEGELEPEQKPGVSGDFPTENRQEPPPTAPNCTPRGAISKKQKNTEEMTVATKQQGTISYVAREIRDEAKRCAASRGKVKHQLRGFGREAVHQVGSGRGEEFARQIFGPGSRTPRRRP
jgi:hypothetical protein